MSSMSACKACGGSGECERPGWGPESCHACKGSGRSLTPMKKYRRTIIETTVYTKIVCAGSEGEAMNSTIHVVTFAKVGDLGAEKLLLKTAVVAKVELANDPSEDREERVNP